jgi:hypothetical protein
MPGRKKIENVVLKCKIFIEGKSGATYTLDNVPLMCPDCLTTEVRPNGTRKLKETRYDAYICKNPKCKRKRKKASRQFAAHTSGFIKSLVNEKIEEMVREIYVNGSKAKSVASSYGVSDTFVSFLRDEVDEAIEKGLVRDELVDEPTDDDKVSMDETFFKIGKTKIYVIITRGYKTKKVLGIHVSITRKESDMRASFDEAQRNTVSRINTITSDAWGATRKMVRGLMYPVTLIVHKHNKPYDKAVIERIDYDNENRIVTQVGIKTDVFTRPGKREYRYQTIVESTVKPPAKKRGRPKGSKNKPRNSSKKNIRRENGDKRASTRSSATGRRDTSRSSRE